MMLPRFRRRVANDHGGALVELALSLPLLVVILAGTVDFARVFYMSVALTNAARAGAQWGATLAHMNSPALMQTTAVNATNLSGVTAAASSLCMCSTDAGVLTPTTPANTCTATCPSGGHIVATVTVETRKAFTTAMNVLPGVPNSITIVRSATLRVAN